jgi:putative membrane protein
MVASTVLERFSPRSPALVIVLAGALAAVAAGCRDRNDDRAKTRLSSVEVPVNAGPAVPPHAALNELDDAQVLAALRAANAGEMAEATVALARASDPRVRALAESMLNEHRNDDAALAELGAHEAILASESDTSDSVRAVEQASLEDLLSRSGTDFDRAYLDAQVRDHEVFLATIDNTLLRATTNGSLKQMLAVIRDRVADHARRARELRADFNKSQQP